ncbi:head assembly protein [Pantoea phage Phynn]|nr:head assembly protein [Pantoea phage Phynn]
MQDIEEQTNKYLKDALSDVIQELILVDKSGVSHLVYIHKLYWANNQVCCEFSTPESDKEALRPLVMEAMNAQIQEAGIPVPEYTRWEKFKAAVSRIIQSYF